MEAQGDRRALPGLTMVAHADGQLLPWPYPLRYDKVEQHETDILILGGGIAGVWAAIAAARCGMRVTIMEKSVTERSGAGGAGVDHWQWATDSPASRVTPEEFTQALIDNQGGYRNGISTYIQCASSYEALLEMEQMGGKVRDSEDDFLGAEFRDDQTKLLFAYDYHARTVIRVWGANFKPLLRKQCQRLGVKILDRTSATALLTENGRLGAPLAGATGVNCRTGAFVVVKAKAVILATSRPQRIWTFSSELRGLSTFRPPSDAGNGFAMAWRAGARFTMMEKSMRSPFGSPYSYPAYGVGNAINTWYPCTLVDANGKEVPWVDTNGELLHSVAQRCQPARGQKFFIMGGGSSSHPHPGLPQYAGPKPIPDLGERMERGEFVPPFYADLASMPELERKAIWGLMVGNEGKTRISVMQTYMRAGFDPAIDMLQSYDFLRGSGMREPVMPQERTFGEQGVCGGMVVDWDLMSDLPGLFGVGDLIFGSPDHSHAATTGRYAGARAALYCRKLAKGSDIDPAQVQRERERVYAPVCASHTGPDWKELNASVARVMQNYCSEPKNAELLRLAGIWLDDLELNEAGKVYADNPHQLMRALDVIDILTCARMIVHACEARKASSTFLHFKRLDYPTMDPPEWHKWITVRCADSSRSGASAAVIGEMPIAFWGDLEQGYRPRYQQNMAAMGGELTRLKQRRKRR